MNLEDRQRLADKTLWVPTFIINPPEPEEFPADLRRRAALPPGG